MKHLQFIALLAGAAIVVGAGAFLYFMGPAVLDADTIGLVLFLVACTLVVVGAAVVVIAWTDWHSDVEVTGPVLRLREFGDQKHRRYYVAVDDGASGSIRAWRVTPARYAGLTQGEVVTARLTRNLCCVRWVVPAQAGEGSLAAAG